jgi:hypothetical protein
MKRRGITVFSLIALALLVALRAGPAHAVSRALLVGVSDYPRLPDNRRLHGPRNDVRLMADLLTAHGFAREHITILADGLPGAGLPTRQAILDALRRMAGTAQADDFLYVHFSGHGSQQPHLNSDDPEEPDGLDEIFLPYDADKWESETSKVLNSITDDEIGAALAAIRKKGTFVWAVFDTCHAGTMLRGAPARGITYRKISPEELGIPAGHMTRVRGDRQNQPAAAEELPGGYVAFYAAQSHELAPEATLPRGTKDAMPYGLFTFSIARILSDNRAMTYRQAAQSILQFYTASNIRMPTPVFEGTGLDSPLFGREGGAAIRQWPVETRLSRYFINAGRLHRIEAGSVFVLLADPVDSEKDGLGYAAMQNVGLNRSELVPLKYNGRPAPDMRQIPRNCYARLVEPRVDFTLAVALPPPGERENDPRVRKTAALLEQIRSMPQPSGIRINWVAAGEPADIRLGFSPAGHPQCPADRLWFLPPDGGLVCNGPGTPVSIILDKNPEELRKALYANLRAMGKVTNLLRLAETVIARQRQPDLELTMFLRRAGQKAKTVVTPEQFPRLREGDRIWIEAHNRGRRPVDLTVLFVDSRYGISAEFPAAGELNRIPARATVADVIDATINVETTGTERLIAIAVAAEPLAPAGDFSFLAQASLPGTRDGQTVTCSENQCSLEGWLKQAGFGANPSRGMASNRMDRLRTNVSLFAWTTEP